MAMDVVDDDDDDEGDNASASLTMSDEGDNHNCNGGKDACKLTATTTMPAHW
jgi:hypothetical protein